VGEEGRGGRGGEGWEERWGGGGSGILSPSYIPDLCPSFVPLYPLPYPPILYPLDHAHIIYPLDHAHRTHPV
jgi:hypothetical protein